MNRSQRQAAILRLVRERAISTQGELADALRDAGFEVVQTTVSRDVAELGLVKVRAPSGRLVYAPPGASDADRLRGSGRRDAPLRHGRRGDGNLVVLTTPSGYANALAQAIDEGRHPAIAGTVAGDNTIFVAVHEGAPRSPSATSCWDTCGRSRLMGRTAVVAFSGGLDTSCIVSWLKEDGTASTRSSPCSSTSASSSTSTSRSSRPRRRRGRRRAGRPARGLRRGPGARAIKANALYEGKYPLVSALSRPSSPRRWPSSRSSSAPRRSSTAAPARATTSSASSSRSRRNYPGVNVIAPLRDRVWTREEEIAYALEKRHPRQATRARPTRSTRTCSAGRSRPACSRIRGRRRPRSRTR